MCSQKRFSRGLTFPWLQIIGFLILVLLLPASTGLALDTPRNAEEAPGQPAATCTGGPTIDGVLLDECYDEIFLVGGVNKTVRVWYTNVATTATRTQDGTTYSLEH